jgi:hypothetical protein
MGMFNYQGEELETLHCGLICIGFRSPEFVDYGAVRLTILQHPVTTKRPFTMEATIISSDYPKFSWSIKPDFNHFSIQKIILVK